MSCPSPAAGGVFLGLSQPASSPLHRNRRRRRRHESVCWTAVAFLVGVLCCVTTAGDDTTTTTDGFLPRSFDVDEWEPALAQINYARCARNVASLQYNATLALQASLSGNLTGLLQSERVVAYSDASPAQELRDTVADWASAAELYDFEAAAPADSLTARDGARVRAWMRMVWSSATEIGCAMRVPNTTADTSAEFFVVRCVAQPVDGIDAVTTRSMNIFEARDPAETAADCRQWQDRDTEAPDAATGDNGYPDYNILYPWMSLGWKMEAVWPRTAPSSAGVWAAKMSATLRKALALGAAADGEEVSSELTVYVALVCPLAENGEKLAVDQGGSACTRMFRNGTIADSATMPPDAWADADDVGATLLTKALPGGYANETSANATHSNGTAARGAAALSETRQEFDDIAGDADTWGVYVEVILEDATEERISASVQVLKSALLAADKGQPPLFDLSNIEADLLVIAPLPFNTGEIVTAVQAGDYYTTWQRGLSESLNEPDFIVPDPCPDGVGDVRKDATGSLNEGHWAGVAAGCAALCVLVSLAVALGVSRVPKDDCVTVKDFYRSMPGGDPERGECARSGGGYSPPPPCAPAERESVSSVEMADLLSTKNSLKNLTFSNVQPCGRI